MKKANDATETDSNQVKLDRTRSFGMISGEIEGFPGACYAQDGNFYDSNGNKLING